MEFPRGAPKSLKICLFLLKYEDYARIFSVEIFLILGGGGQAPSFPHPGHVPGYVTVYHVTNNQKLWQILRFN